MKTDNRFKPIYSPTSSYGGYKYQVLSNGVQVKIRRRSVGRRTFMTKRVITIQQWLTSTLLELIMNKEKTDLIEARPESFENLNKQQAQEVAEYIVNLHDYLDNLSNRLHERALNIFDLETKLKRKGDDY